MTTTTIQTDHGPVTVSPVYSREDAERLNEQRGMFYFTPDTMRFFSSRVMGEFFLGDGESFFVTSEQAPRSFVDGYRPARAYSVRSINWATGDVRTVGDFQEHSTRGRALCEARHQADRMTR